MSTFVCPTCGAPISVEYGAAVYTCTCRFNQAPRYAPMPTTGQAQCVPLVPITEQRVREIIREELARIEASKPSSDNP